MARCPICYTTIQSETGRVECSECRQQYHQVCWDDLGGCATYGCARAVPGEKPTPTARTQAGWGDTKKCPKCAATIASSLLVCACGARFPYADAMTTEQYSRWSRERTELSSMRTTLVVLFILSLFGIPAPLTGTVAGVYAHRNRKRLAGTDGTYLAMGYGAAAIGLTYALIFMLLMLGL